MKTFSILPLSLALISAMATEASAYHFLPKDMKIALRGAPAFYPEGQQPFKCKLTFYLKTKGTAGIIRSYKLDHVSRCAGVHFGLPMYAGVINANSGQLGPFSFVGGGSHCSQSDLHFTVNKSGVFKFPPGQCMSGAMTSHPTTTIAGKP
jgi:hypothetical protein